jgi:beta-aspartyl-dipeptidase (metallo-type)
LHSGQLLQLALEARVGGLLGGKPGIVHCHLGPGRAGLDPLRAALELGGGDLPITAFHPTHVERSPQLVEQGAAWLADGGSLDLTAGSPACLAALRGYRQAGLPLAAVTVSSDAYGSLPVFDEGGRLVRMDVAEPGAGTALVGIAL